MDSKKTRYSADSATLMVARIRVTREALCGRYLTFAARDVLRGRRLVGLAAGADRQPETMARPVRRWKLRQR
jgi:hypothetical protein